jgi:putative membrane protein
MLTSPRAELRSIPASHARRIVPLDVFIAVNLALFACLCVFTYYARFIAYRGAANVWEFFVYAAVIVLVIAGAWLTLRRSAIAGRMLLLVQAGILAHFAGAFVQWDGLRLYDHAWFGIRYDKFVHLLNAFVAVRAMAHICERRGVRVAGVTKFVVGLSVLGLGAIVEIVEYLVMLTIPGNGVGGYDNNMQDLIANGIGALGSALTMGDAGRRLSVVASPRPAYATGTRMLSAVEVTALTAGILAGVWIGPLALSRFAYAAVMAPLLVGAFIYTSWWSPLYLHRDRLAARGLGAARNWFVRADNLRAASRQFLLLALVGTVAILLLAEWRNPGWVARANWQAWVVRLLFYAVSAYLQALIFVGFVLVRLQDIFHRRLSVALAAASLFAVLHAPDPLLVLLTAVFAFAVAWISVRTPNVLAAAGCQLVLGLLVHRALELSLRVGSLRTHPGYYAFRELLPPVQWVIGSLY